MYKYIVTSNTLTATNVLILQAIAQRKKDIFDFNPGQYVAISFVKNGRPSPMRCFSIASSSSNKGALEFGIRIGGAFTSELAKLKPNDELLVAGPFGDLVLHPSKVKEAVLIAGGIGITPLLCMIRTSSARNWPIKIKLLYSTRTKKETAYASEIVRLYRNNPNFDPYFFLSKETGPSQNPNIIAGPISLEYLEKIVGNDFKSKAYYLCGPPGFMAAMEKMLLAKGVYSGQIISERFCASDKTLKLDSSQGRVFKYSAIAIAICMLLILSGDAIKTNAKFSNNNSLFQNSTRSTSSVESSPPNNSTSVTPTQAPTTSIPRRRSSSRVSPPQPAQTPTPAPPIYNPPVTSVS